MSENVTVHSAWLGTCYSYERALLSQPAKNRASRPLWFQRHRCVTVEVSKHKSRSIEVSPSSSKIRD